MLPHQSTIHSTESLIHAQFYEEVLNITGDEDYCLLVVVLVQDAHEKNITVSQLHSESQISYATQQVLVYGVACTASNTSSSICTFCLPQPVHASGMNAPVSLKMWCTTAHVCWAASSLDTNIGIPSMKLPPQMLYMKCILVYSAVVNHAILL